MQRPVFFAQFHAGGFQVVIQPGWTILKRHIRGSMQSDGPKSEADTVARLVHQGPKYSRLVCEPEIGKI